MSSMSRGFRKIVTSHLSYFLTVFRIDIDSLRGKCGNLNYDLIHAHYIYPNGLFAVLLGRYFNVPVVLTGHGSDINLFPRLWWNRLLAKWILARATRLIVVSGALKTEVLRLGVTAEKIAVIPNGFDRTIFKPMDMQEARGRLNLSRRNKIFLFVGNLVRVKNIPLLLRAFSEVVKDEKNVSLIVVGDGPEKRHLDQLADRLDIHEHVQFVGQRPHSDIPLWINACDVLCLSSDNEGWPTIIVETLACGKPVVATETGGVPEILCRSELGITVPVGDRAVYTKAMRESINKEWNSDIISSYAQEFTWEKIAESLQWEYRSALDRG